MLARILGTALKPALGVPLVAAIVAAAVLFTKPLAAAELPEKSRAITSSAMVTWTFTWSSASSKQQ